MRTKKRKRRVGGPNKNGKGTTQAKKPYRSPHLSVYGELRRLTRGSTGPQRDGSPGSPKSKATGGG